MKLVNALMEQSVHGQSHLTERSRETDNTRIKKIAREACSLLQHLQLLIPYFLSDKNHGCFIITFSGVHCEESTLVLSDRSNAVTNE